MYVSMYKLGRHTFLKEICESCTVLGSIVCSYYLVHIYIERESERCRDIIYTMQHTYIYAIYGYVCTSYRFQAIYNFWSLKNLRNHMYIMECSWFIYIEREMERHIIHLYERVCSM